MGRPRGDGAPDADHRRAPEDGGRSGGASRGRGAPVSFARQSLFTFLTRLAVSLINLPVSILIVRTLGASGQGIYSAAATLTTLWAIFGLLGIDAAHTYLLAGRRAPLGRILAHSLILTAGLSLVLVPSFLVLAPAAVGATAADFGRYAGLAAMAIPLIVARYMLLSVFLGRKRIGTFNILNAVSALSLLALIAGLVVTAGSGPGGAVLAFVLSTAVFVAAAVFWLARISREGESLRMELSWETLRFSFIYGLKGHLVTVLSQFNYRFDMILVLRWLGTAAQGYYSVAVLLAEKLSHITASVQLVLFPWVSGSRREEADRLTPWACRHTLFWVAAAGAVLFFAGPFLIDLLYTDDFQRALPAFRVLIPGIIALTLSKLLSSDLSGRNRRGLPTIAMAAAFAVNLGLNFILIPRHGILGAAWASTIAYSLQTAIMIVFFTRVSGVPAWELVRWRGEDLQLYRRWMKKARDRVGGRRDDDDVERILPGPPVDPEGPA
ncbi:MAG: oligosaccharide flippase family protein [Candidatus Eisenbacteria bacterium]|nr:oligosaccharide flippase family protein [Candidatus Eisenbacteria bacterium]